MPDTPAPSPAGDSTHWLPPSPEELQALLPQYEITALIGRGGMGAVYRGKQVHLDRAVAIKILPSGLDETDATFSERFRNEALAMAKLNHPGLVAVYDFGTTRNGMLYIVMEYVDGTDVAHMMAKKGRLSSEHAMAITAHVCDALKYAHERGIVHRDIKPANIMVGYDGVVKVADFGLAKTSQSSQSTGLTQSGLAMGTMHYIAPEALTLGCSVDQRADIYAMGVMLYHMLTGGLPHGMFELPSLQVPGLDPRYDAIISRALRNDRDKRYQSVVELRHDLDAILTRPVVVVDANVSKAPAALNTTARPQRPAGPPLRSAAQPQRNPQKQVPRPPPPEHSNLGFWVPVVGVAVVCAGFVIWAEQRKANSSTPLEAAASESLKALTIAEATKEHPFTNSLGMKFVPVPGTDVLMCIHETRNQDYKSYASAVSGVNPSPAINDKSPVDEASDHPVRNVRYDDAVGFCQWLSKYEGKAYRLATDQEWSYAAGIGPDEKREESTTPEMLTSGHAKEFPWGDQWPPPQGFGNFGDTSYKEAIPNRTFIEGYTDGFPTTAPVMSFKPNQLGLYDMSGNVSEWVQDWWNEQQQDRTFRGACYCSSERMNLLASFRWHLPPSASYNNANHGFRIVLELDPSKTAGAASSAPVNTLPAESGFTPLLNKDHQEGWKNTGRGSIKEDEGVFTLNEGCLYWHEARTFANFILRLDFKVASARDNSGVFIRATGAGFNPWERGYEIEILGPDTGKLPFTKDATDQPPPIALRRLERV
jgi:serine/threonine protein kinase